MAIKKSKTYNIEEFGQLHKIANEKESQNPSAREEYRKKRLMEAGILEGIAPDSITKEKETVNITEQANLNTSTISSKMEALFEKYERVISRFNDTDKALLDFLQSESYKPYKLSVLFLAEHLNKNAQQIRRALKKMASGGFFSFDGISSGRNQPIAVKFYPSFIRFLAKKT
jgi:predicted transcriptional regulator